MHHRHLLLAIIPLFGTLQLWSQNYAPKEVHYGGFYYWSPLSNEGFRFAAKQDSSNIHVDGNIHSFNDSNENVFMLRVNPDGSLKSSLFAEDAYSSSDPRFVNTPKGTYIVGELGYRNGDFSTTKFSATMDKDGFDDVGYLGYFEDDPKPKSFLKFTTSNKRDFYGFGPYMRQYSVDDQGNVFFYTLHGYLVAAGSVNYGHFSLGSIQWKHFGKNGYTKRLYLGATGSGFSSGCELEFVLGRSIRGPYPKGDGGYFIIAKTGGSILIQKNGITQKELGIKQSSYVILEFNKNSVLVNHLLIPDKTYVTFSHCKDKKMRFNVLVRDTTTFFKLGDSIFPVSSNTTGHWLFELQSSGKVKKILTHQSMGFSKPIHGYASRLGDFKHKGYDIFEHRPHGSFEYRGERYHFPKDWGHRYVFTIVDSNYNILNMIPGVNNARFAANGDVAAQLYHETHLEYGFGSTFPDSIKNSLKPKDYIYSRYDRGFIFSRLVDSTFSYCPGQPIHIKPMSLDTFDAANVFTMQLSDSSGSFANPTVIGTLKSSVLDTVIGYVPNTVPGAKRYRVRLVSSSPKHIGINNSFDVEINDPVSRPNASDVYYCVGETPAALTPSGPGIRWYTNPSDTMNGGVSTPPTPSTAIAGTTTYLVTQPDSVCGVSWMAVDVNVMAADTPVISQADTLLVSSISKNIQWYKNDTVISGATNDTLKHTGAGSYGVEYTDSNGCKSLATWLVKNVSSTEMSAQAWSAYPNPFRDQILVEHIALKSIKLINRQGQVVLEGRSAQLSTENIVPGLYHLEVTSVDGSTQRRKMVKY